MTEPLGPTVVLIGGCFMVDAGSALNSRQPIEKDPWDLILRGALVGSDRWWEVALSLAQILVDQDSQPDPWVLVWAPKTVRHLKPGGGSKRTSIDSILPGAVSLMDDRFHRGVTIDASLSNERYRILEHPLRYTDLVAARPPTAAFGAHPTSWDLIGLAPWNAVLSRWPGTTLIAPDTPLIRARMLVHRRNHRSPVRSEAMLPCRDAQGDRVRSCRR